MKKTILQNFSDREKIVWRVFLAFITLTFIFPTNTYAIVIGGPVIAISVIKLSALLVSILAVPLTTLIQLLKKDRKKASLLSLFILLAIFSLAFASLNFVAPKTQRAPLKAPLEDRFYEKPFYPEYPVPEFKAPRIEPITVATLLFFLLLLNLVFLSGPTFIGILLTNKLGQKKWSKKRFLAVWFLVDLNFSIMGTFALALIWALTAGGVTLY